MDVKQIVQLLQATFSQNNNDRRLAEEHLSKVTPFHFIKIIAMLYGL
jgi:hypothetical protein